ncbi:MAG: DUF1858 domain-containing protein [Candidatus Izemoplasma sp.]
MDKTISLTDSIYKLVNKHEEIIEIMKKLGFDGMTNRSTINTVGRVMTLQKGARLKNIDINKIVKEFENNGFIVKE